MPSFLQYPTLGRTKKTVVKVIELHVVKPIWSLSGKFLQRLSGPPTEATEEGDESLTRYYNLEANNNNNNNGSVLGGGVKEMSKPMKLGQPIDGRLGKTLLSTFMNQWQIKPWNAFNLNNRKSSRETPSGSFQGASFTEGKGEWREEGPDIDIQLKTFRGCRQKAPKTSVQIFSLTHLKVAGMEAPAPPSFHLVCKGFPSTEQSIALLYSPSCPSGDTTSWW